MVKKMVIANIGKGGQGKSSSIRELFDLFLKIKRTCHYHIIEDDGKDIKAIITIGNVKIGIESQGDPGSRMIKSMDDFVKEGCDIIVTACRTYGATHDKVCELEDKHKYEAIWVLNDRTRKRSNQLLIDYLNKLYAERVVKIIDDRIAGII